jgi:poly(A) polymerase
VDGYRDVVDRRVRFIGDPVTRIREDYLRILRFFRFNATYGSGSYDEAGLAACIAERQGLEQLSGERIREEILRLLVAPGVLQAAEVLNTTGIAEVILGRGGDTALLGRIIAIEDALGRQADDLLRLASLACRTREDAAELATRLKLSNEQRGRLEAAMFAGANLDPSSDLIQAKAAWYDLCLNSFERAYIMAWARSGAAATDDSWRSRFEAMTNWKVPEFPFKGADVVRLGVAPGPDVGLVLQRFRSWWIGAGFPEDADLLRGKLLELARPFTGEA